MKWMNMPHMSGTRPLDIAVNKAKCGKSVFLELNCREQVKWGGSSGLFVKIHRQDSDS